MIRTIGKRERMFKIKDMTDENKRWRIFKIKDMIDKKVIKKEVGERKIVLYDIKDILYNKNY